MKNNRYINVLLSLLIALIASGCSEKNKNVFVIQGELINGRKGQMVSLYQFLPQYQSVRLLDSARIVNNHFEFTGTCETRTPAFIKIDDGKEGLYFFLSNSDLKFSIGQNSYFVTGTDDNLHLSQIVTLQHKTADIKRQNQKQYLEAIADSTLTQEMEDSLLVNYTHASARLRKLILSEISQSMDTDKIYAGMCLRLFSPYITIVEVDSLSRILNVPKTVVLENQ